MDKLENDCVIRAITNASSKRYFEVLEDLHKVSQLYDCPVLCACCYFILLEKYYNYIVYNKYKGLTIKQFIMNEPKGKYLIRVEGHLTFVENGKIKDVFDCSYMIIDKVWKVC